MVSGYAVLFSYKGTALPASTDLMVASGNTPDPGSDLFIRMGTPFFTTSAGIGL